MSEVKDLKLALVGNPNAGKTSLFNQLTGLNQKVGNYPGITVDKKTGSFTAEQQKVQVIDLPGAYSLYPKAKDDLIVLDVLTDQDHHDYPDLIIFVADASNLKRNLLFFSQVYDLKLPVIIALNMLDIAELRALEIDIRKLSEQLKVPVIPISARKNKGIDKLKDAIIHYSNNEQFHEFINMKELEPDFFGNLGGHLINGSEYGSFQLLANYSNLNSKKKVKLNGVGDIVASNKGLISKIQGKEVVQRYTKIDQILSECLHYSDKKSNTPAFSEKLDKVLTHKIWGYGIFMLIMFLVFQGLYTIAAYPMELIEQVFVSFQEWIKAIFPASILTSLFADGIVAGLGSIVVFIPQIAILFAFLTVLEDSGYMARVSFLMDRVMRASGMNGRSVVPLVGSLACAVPSIMAARSIPNPKERLITIMSAPFMSCSARLPVYILLIGLIAPDRMLAGFISVQGLVLLGMYVLGIVMTMTISWLLSFFVKNSEKSSFFLELPIYRMPRWNNVFVTMYEKSKVFVLNVGKIILVISVVLWFLASFGPVDLDHVGQEYRQKIITSGYSESEIENLVQSEKLSHSYIGILGKQIEPVIEPLGYDWKIGIALLTSFAAREVFIGTVATLYGAADSDAENYLPIRQKMLSDMHPGTKVPVFSLATVISLLIFYAFAMQCMSTFAIVKRETKTWKWPVIQLVMMTFLAYISSFVVYQLLK